jgi:hypothetical protein
LLRFIIILFKNSENEFGIRVAMKKEDGRTRWTLP